MDSDEILQCVKDIGHLRQYFTGDTARFVGFIRTPPRRLNFQLIPVEGSQHPNAPSHQIIVADTTKRTRQIGSAWTKTMKRHGRKGEQFLTLTFDRAGLPKPVNVAAFQISETEWRVCFRSRQRRTEAQTKPDTHRLRHSLNTVADTGKTQKQSMGELAATLDAPLARCASTSSVCRKEARHA